MLMAVFAGWAAKKYAILPLDPDAAPTGLRWFSGVATIAMLVLLGRLTVFMVSAERTTYSVMPYSKWEVGHSCLSAYYIANQAAYQTTDIYANSLYSLPDDNPESLRKARTIESFKVDVYEYPPQFLILPRLMSFLTSDFLRMRMLWFGMNGFVILIALLVISPLPGKIIGTRALMYSPLILAALPVQSMLQKGNIQSVIIALSMISMTLFAKRKIVTGALTLAYAIVSKIYPGLLVIYLIGRRQLKALTLIVMFGILLTLLSFFITGWQAYIAFFHHLPGLLGGEAFPAFRNPAAMGINFSIPGLIFKLKLFGVPGMGFPASKLVGWIYTLIIIPVILLAARRTNEGQPDSPVLWLGILTLATLRSPFLPQAYASFPPIWLLTLLCAYFEPTFKTLLIVFLIWFSLNLYVPMDVGVEPWRLALISGIPQFVTIALAFFATTRTPGGPTFEKQPIFR